MEIELIIERIAKEWSSKAPKGMTKDELRMLIESALWDLIAYDEL